MEKIRAVIDTYEEIIRIHQLNEELLETLELSLLWLNDYSKKHNFPIPNKEKITRLLRRTTDLIEEIRKPNQNSFIRRKNTELKSDADDTEPKCEKVFSSVLLQESQIVNV